MGEVTNACTTARGVIFGASRRPCGQGNASAAGAAEAFIDSRGPAYSPGTVEAARR